MNWMCPECLHTMVQVSEDKYICDCGTRIIQQSLFTERERDMGLKKQIQKNSMLLHNKAVKTAHKSYAEGVAVGFQQGMEEGFEKGMTYAKGEAITRIKDMGTEVKQALDMFYDRIKSLREVPDIGEKRFKAIVEYLGYTLEELSEKGS